MPEAEGVCRWGRFKAVLTFRCGHRSTMDVPMYRDLVVDHVPSTVIVSRGRATGVLHCLLELRDRGRIKALALPGVSLKLRALGCR